MEGFVGKRKKMVSSLRFLTPDNMNWKKNHETLIGDSK